MNRVRTSRMIGGWLAAAVLATVAQSQVPRDAYFESQATALRSPDWSVRSAALSRLEAYGPSANELLVQALGDKSDLISSRAQDWLVRQGHTVTAFLADELASAEEDTGLFARIAGGRERHRGKSIASTLWLAVARGTAPELRYGEIESLLGHRSPRVRAVAVFAAVTLRSEQYLPLLEKASGDDDPLVRKALHQGLVRLLQRASYSTPVLDAATEGGALDLLAPKLAEAAEDDDHGFSNGGLSYGAMLGHDPLEHHRDRFRDLLESTLSQELSPTAQENIGRGLAVQTESEDLEALVERLLAALPDREAAEVLPAQLVALSSLPDEGLTAESLEVVTRWLETVQEPHRQAARLAASAYSRAKSLRATELGDRAAAVLVNLLRDPASVVEAAIAVAEAPEIWRRKPSLFAGQKKEDAGESVRQALAEQADTLFDASAGASVERICDLVQVFLQLSDDRHFELFERAWEHRHTESIRDQEALSGVLWNLGFIRRDPRLIDILRPYVADAKTQQHTLVLDSAAAALVGGLARLHGDFVDDELLATWLAILEDPEIHPRLRSRISMLIQTKGLPKGQAEKLRAASMRVLSQPVDDNLREKILSRLVYMGDRGALPDAYSMLIREDQVWWAYGNLTIEIPGAAWEVETEELIEILDGLRKRYGPPGDEVKLVPVNNYFRWAVQYQIYPPRAVADELKRRTGEDFGYDADAWRRWLAESESS